MQICGKLMATEGKHEHWDGTNLLDEFHSEIADLIAAIHFVQKRCNLDYERIYTRMIEKLARFEAWHEGKDGSHEASSSS
jgi:hypothetical protein